MEFVMFLLNQQAAAMCDVVRTEMTDLRVATHTLACGAEVFDFGVRQLGGLLAGEWLAEICLAGRADVNVLPGDRNIWPGPWVQVTSDDPVVACMAAQYAGWPVKVGDYFAMGSGPMRAKRGKEHVLQTLSVVDSSEFAVGVLEADQLPSDEVAISVAAECGVDPHQLRLLVAPTRSLAGVVQVVARSIETSLHKLFELGFPLDAVKSAHGIAPLPPPAKDFVKGIGRTNDAILYGGLVTLYVDIEDDKIKELGPRVPSQSSRDFGAPFAEIFKKYNFDFYQVDAGLFSPAEIVFSNLRSGHSYRYGAPRPDLIAKSFT
jgi:methenyltetrahydromethanopterin cyclohydrolase